MHNLTGCVENFRFYPKQNRRHCTDFNQRNTALICHLNIKISLAAVWSKNLTTQEATTEGSKETD